MSHAKTKHTTEESVIFGKTALFDLLKDARKTLEENGTVKPMLFLELSNGAGFITALQMPGEQKLKYRMFQEIGETIQLCGVAIEDAILLTETWIVPLTEATDVDKDISSQHPCRQQAIALIARNAARTHVAIVIQTFSIDEHNAPVWSEPRVIISDSPKTEMASLGPLDALFGN